MANKKFETLDGFNSQGDVTIAGNVAVDTDVLYVDTVNNRVGVGKTNPASLLDVDGNITATNVNAEFHGDGSNITDVDAATLDGISIGSLLRSDTSDTFTGESIEFSNANVALTGASGKLLMNTSVPLRFGTTSTPSVTFTFSNTDATSGNLDITTNGTIGITIENDLDIGGAITATNIGTIASQDADSVNIDGGAIDGTPIGVNSANTGQFSSLGVGTAASGTTGEIRATNNITAFYSDARLKTFTGRIDSPLEKIDQLNGYTFVMNDLARSFGYTSEKQHVGVSAQEVEKVLPEIVSLAPFDTYFDDDGNECSKSGENYKTVDYDKLVALLIEGMKAQNERIRKLEELLEK